MHCGIVTMLNCVDTSFIAFKAACSQTPVCAWFLEIAFVQKVGMCGCMCVSAPRLLKTIHVK